MSLWRKAWPLIWTNLTPLHLRMLCTKFGWNWPSGYEEDIKILLIVLSISNTLDYKSTNFQVATTVSLPGPYKLIGGLIIHLNQGHFCTLSPLSLTRVHLAIINSSSPGLSRFQLYLLLVEVFILGGLGVTGRSKLLGPAMAGVHIFFRRRFQFHNIY